MTTEDIFNSDPNDIDPPVVDDNKDYFAEYVGEGKQYRDERVLAKAVFDKDQFIEQLKRENAGMRNDLKQRIGMEEFLDKLNNSQNDNSSNDDSQGNHERGSSNTALTAEDVQKLIEQREATRTREQNLASVERTLKDQLGPNYLTHVQKLVSDLGMGTKEATDLAAKSPSAFYRMLGLNQEKPIEPTAPRSSINTSGFRPTGGTKRTYEDFEKLRREKPAEYWTPKVQNEIMKLAMEMGEEFGHLK